MKKKKWNRVLAVFLMMVISISLLSGCGSKNAEKEDAETNELNSGMNSIDYNAISGQLTILNGEHQILCQRDNPKFNLFKEFGVNEEDVQCIRVLLHQTSVQNKEISATIKATVENNSQMYRMKLHTLWSPLKKDGYIGIIGYFDTVK